MKLGSNGKSTEENAIELPKPDIKSNAKWLAGISVGVIVLFVTLMIYGLLKDPNALPSQLIGRSAPLFRGDLAQGGHFGLADKVGHGRWVVVNFWSTTCVVCREEAPELERFFKHSEQGQGPEFVSVNIQESTADILRYEKERQLSYPVVKDEDGKISLDYGVTGTPETFFISPQGIVRHRVAGGVDYEVIHRFVDWLESNPDAASAQAVQGFLTVRSKI